MPHANAGHAGPRDYLYFRHALPVRLMHWTNVVALTILLMSGLQIFNAHPSLYWAGKSSYTGAPPVLEIGAQAKRRVRVGRHHARLRPRIRHDRRARRVEDRRWPACGACISVVDDDSGQSLAVDGAGVALLLRVGAAHQRPGLRRAIRRRAGISRATSRPTATTGARSARRSATTCASAIRRARRPGATTCCRSSLISP